MWAVNDYVPWHLLTGSQLCKKIAYLGLQHLGARLQNEYSIRLTSRIGVFSSIEY